MLPSLHKISPSEELIEKFLGLIPYQYYGLYLNGQKEAEEREKEFADLLPCYEYDMAQHNEYYTEKDKKNSCLSFLDNKLFDKELITNYPKNWLEEYFEEGFFEVDPVLTRSCYSLTPFVWGHNTKSYPRISETQQENFVLKKASKHNIIRGLSVPIAVGRQNFGVFTLTFPERLIMNELQIYNIFALSQNISNYIISFQYPSYLYPLEENFKKTIWEKYNFILEISSIVEKLFSIKNIKKTNLT